MTAPKKPAREGAPKLETPEKPATVPADAPRDEDSQLETPEDPREWTQAVSQEDLLDMKKDALKEEAAAHDLPVSGTKAELAERIVDQVQAEEAEAEEARLEQEALHVSISPVNSHAPVWLPREPGSP